ncbi:hypothetical protein [Clostridium tagluense]|uniref:hypothetical protein n=1 Tax=Clostridium tagluense TaxID=360422 RepID=UPI001C6E7672|nr:hypothetical protein [Clostridium tagluense]MBW9159699.1 hypothetical protein [Clostridium tagluense]WLC65369.1 hypothetical protein KTC93_21565 [Clostridium tagluense]
MGKISDFFQGIMQPKKSVFTIENKEGTTTAVGNKIANIINESYYFNIKDPKQLEEVYESVINKDSSIELREIIIPIESLITEGKFSLAIQKYEELIASLKFESYSKDDRFLIYNGLLNCHINNDAFEYVIKHWIVKIEALGPDIKEIHRFYFLLAIWKHNNHELDNALILIAQSLKAKPDYMNAITTEILFKCNKRLITYTEAKKQFKSLLKTPDLGVKDYAVMYSSFGDIAFNNKDYSNSKENYSKSNELSRSLSKEIGMAICEYFEAFRVIREDGKVEFENIDFDVLKRSEEKFDRIYINRIDDTIETIVRMCFAFLFNILALTNNFNKILLLYNETKEYFNSNMIEAIENVAEAEVVTGSLNKDTLEKLNEYQQIKYEALYLERINSHEAEINLLLPALEGKYRDDKVLQLSLLNALKETNQFERYMEYYKRFSGHQDDVMRMNYIQFLIKLNKKHEVLLEIERLKSVVQNSFVLYDLLLIYVDYKLETELDEFFEKVDSGVYKIIGLQMSFVFYNKMIHLLNKKRYEEYFKLYETTDMSFLKDTQRIVLKINYYTFKGNYDEIATSFYELFQATGNHNELLKAVQVKLDINKYHEADFYLQLVNPMEIEKPEIYYMFKVIILNEYGKAEEAFKVLNETIEMVADNLDSPFHQFYTAFNMNNGRTDDAVRYMSEHYAKNTTPNWFKVIQYSENESGDELIKKLEEVVGGKRDLSQIDNFFSKGIIGLSTYSHLSGIAIEDILHFKHYPYTKVHISMANVYKTMSDADSIDNKVLIDATTLTILSEVNALNLLDVFDEILMPYSTLQILKRRESGVFSKSAKSVLNYVRNSPYIKNVPIEEGQKTKGEVAKLIPEDILDCISLSENLNVPFLNTEVLVNVEFKLKHLIDMNGLFFYLKKNKPAVRELVAETIGKLRELNLEFMSFDSDDMFIVYSNQGLEGIKPFLKMGINADYKTFNPVYIGFLSRVKNEKNNEEFELCAKEIIRFMDKYVGKTRYYMSCIIRNHSVVKDDFEKLIKKPSVKDILLKNTSYNINTITAFDFIEIKESYDFQKILNISAAFVGFVIQFIALVKDNEAEGIKYIDFIKKNICVNDSEDIDYILYYITRFMKERKDSQ